MNQNQQYDFVNIVKAIAIWLMVFAHLNVASKSLECFIYIFHMPVFAFISGFLDKGELISFPQIKKNVKRFFCPYFFFSICAFSICWIYPVLYPTIYTGQDTWVDIYLSAIKGMFLMVDRVTATSYMPYNSLWFLPALFLVKTIFSVCNGLSGKIKYGDFILFLLSCALLYVIPLKHYVFSFHAALLLLPFYVLGYIYKKRMAWHYSSANHSVLNLLAVVLSTVYLWVFGIQNGRVDVDGCLYGDHFPMYVINAVVGSMGVISLSLLVLRTDRLQFIQKVGRSSVTILGTHLYIVICAKLLMVNVFNCNLNDLPLVVNIITATVACVLGVYIHDFLSQKLPISIGISHRG